jgi:hypothetical protein
MRQRADERARRAMQLAKQSAGRLFGHFTMLPEQDRPGLNIASRPIAIGRLNFVNTCSWRELRRSITCNRIAA